MPPRGGFRRRAARDSAPEHGRALVDHALQNEGADAVVGPTVSNRQGFNHEERRLRSTARFTACSRARLCEVRRDVIQ